MRMSGVVKGLQVAGLRAPLCVAAKRGSAKCSQGRRVMNVCWHLCGVGKITEKLTMVSRGICPALAFGRLLKSPPANQSLDAPSIRNVDEARLPWRARKTNRQLAAGVDAGYQFCGV